MKRLLLLVGIALNSINTSYAIGIVHDPMSYAAIIQEVFQAKETVRNLQQQYGMMQNQWNALKDQYRQLQQNYKAVTGQYGWGRFANHLNGWSNATSAGGSDWSEALKTLSGGSSARFNELLQLYKKDNIVSSGGQFQKGSTVALTKIYNSDVQTNQAVTALATQQFNTIDAHLKTLESLSTQIDSAKNSNIKSAVDLNSRIAIEMALIQIETVRTVTLIAQQQARVQARNISLRTLQAKFNNIPLKDHAP